MVYGKKWLSTKQLMVMICKHVFLLWKLTSYKVFTSPALHCIYRPNCEIVWESKRSQNLSSATNFSAKTLMVTCNSITHVVCAHFIICLFVLISYMHLCHVIAAYYFYLLCLIVVSCVEYIENSQIYRFTTPAAPWTHGLMSCKHSNMLQLIIHTDTICVKTISTD